MTAPDSGEQAPLTRRHRRLQRGERRRSIVTAIALGAFALLMLGFAADVLRLGPGAPVVAQTKSEPEAGTSFTPTRLPETASPCRALSVDKPLRLWIAGDSLAGSLGPALGKLTGDTGVVQPYVDSRVSSGLGNPSFFDWPKQATAEMARLDPEIAVFIIGTNDYTFPTARLDAAGQPAWKADYASRVEAMLSIMIGSGRPVIWAGAPTLRDPRLDEGARQVNEVAKEVVARHKEAVYLDTYALFAGPDGKFARTLPDPAGRTQVMRTDDGIHLTVAGGDHLARAAFEIIDSRCRVTDQAVPNAAKRTIVTPGSAQNPSTPGTSGTTAPATAAPVTTAAATTTTTTTTRPASTSAPSTTLPVPSSSGSTSSTTPTKPQFIT